jgi:hypothetical protein
MGLDFLFELGEFAVELSEGEIKGGANFGSSLVGAQITEPMTKEMEGDFDYVLGRTTLLEVGVKLDFGGMDAVEVSGQRSNFFGGVITKQRVEVMRAIVNGNLHWVILHPIANWSALGKANLLGIRISVDRKEAKRIYREALGVV